MQHAKHEESEALFEPYKALYLHIPFCKKRCAYCDFSTQAIACDSPEIEAYIDKLILSIKRASHQGLLGSVETVYLGGGTPSFIGNKQLSRLLYALSLFMNLLPEMECSLEANPDSLTTAMIKDSFALGVTRLSLGVQSFDDEVLRVLGRVHTARQAKDALVAARERFDNVSVDVMCGIPGQTLQSFVQGLETAVELGVSHVSVYPLALEQGTLLYEQWNSRLFDFDEDAGAEMMQLAQDYLSSQGFARYEVASYAKPGYESLHNSAYWSAKPYLGLGRSAVSMRQNNDVRIREQDGRIIETLTYPERIAEDLMLGMRMTKGVSFELYQTACMLFPQVPQVFESLEAQGLIQRYREGFRPTNQGWLFGNVLYEALLSLSE